MIARCGSWDERAPIAKAVASEIRVPTMVPTGRSGSPGDDISCDGLFRQETLDEALGEKGRVTTRTPTQQDYELLAEFRATLRGFLAFSEDAARHAGLTPRQHQALLAIKGSPAKAPVSIGDLAERLQLRHNTTVELANRLSDAGLIARVSDAADKRRVWLKVTPKGEARLAALSAAHLDDLRRMRQVLRRLLDRLDSD